MWLRGVNLSPQARVPSSMKKRSETKINFSQMGGCGYLQVCKFCEVLNFLCFYFKHFFYYKDSTLQLKDILKMHLKVSEVGDSETQAKVS